MSGREAELQGAAFDYCQYLVRFDSGQYSENEIRAFRFARQRLLDAAAVVLAEDLGSRVSAAAT